MKNNEDLKKDTSIKKSKKKNKSNENINKKSKTKSTNNNKEVDKDINKISNDTTISKNKELDIKNDLNKTKIIESNEIFNNDSISENKDITKNERAIKKKEKLNKEKIKNKKLTKILLILLSIIAILSLSYSGYKIFNWFMDNKKIKDATEQINNMTNINEIKDTENTEIVNPPEDKFDPYWDYIKISLIDVDFSELIKTNPDTVGWLKVDGTNINYPVVKCSNNSFYLDHDFNEKWNDGGWIFMDYRNNPVALDKNTVIYGHSRYDKSMFGSLRNITKNNWFKDTDNHIIKFSSPTYNSLWQVFSVYTIEAEDYYITTDFTSDSDYESWINTVYKRSVFDFKTSVSKDDKTMTLSSCYTSTGIRVVLHAKLIKIDAK